MKTLFIAIMCSLCLSAYSQDSTIESLRKEIINLETEINQLELSHYLQYCKETKELPAIYALKGVSGKYINDPRCKTARDSFEKADIRLGEFLRKYPEYNADMSPKARQMLFSDLYETNPEYRKIRIARDNTLLCSNLIILEAMINDHAQKNLILPTSFINSTELQIIHRQIPGFDLLNRKLSIMKEAYTQKTQQEIEEKYGIRPAK